MKKIVIIVTSSFTFLVVIFLILFFTGKSFLLRNTNLNKKEKLALTNNFSKEEIKYFLERNCENFIAKMIHENDFSKENAISYCDYKNKNTYAEEDIIYLVNANLTDIEYTDIVKQIIHSENIKSENIKRYIEFSQKNENININDVITLVNLDYDTLSEQNDVTKELFLVHYFITENLSRYLAYKQNHAELDANVIVSLVNSNRDYNFYTNTQKANPDKNEKILVNKYFNLDEDYVPELVTLKETYTTRSSRVTKAVQNAFINMAEEAKKQNLTLLCQNAYRSYDSQNYIYNDILRNKGVEYTDAHESRPGFSEYQTGLSLDIVHGKDKNIEELVKSDEFTWLKDNAYKFGFILRYPEGKENITGISYTPYHYRYVGKEVAKTIWTENITLEEYYAYYEK